MHIKDFNMHTLEGAIHMASSLSFLAEGAKCSDRPISFCRSPNMHRANKTLVYVQSNTYCGSIHRDDVRVNVYCSDQYFWRSLCNTYWLFSVLPNRGAQCALTVTIWLSSIPSIRIVMFDVLLWTIRIKSPSLKYYSSGWWLLLWKAGYASSISGGVSILHLIHQQYDIEMSICQSNTCQHVLNPKICWWSTSQSVLSYQ